VQLPPPPPPPPLLLLLALLVLFLLLALTSAPLSLRPPSPVTQSPPSS